MLIINFNHEDDIGHWDEFDPQQKDPAIRGLLVHMDETQVVRKAGNIQRIGLKNGDRDPSLKPALSRVEGFRMTLLQLLSLQQLMGGSLSPMLYRIGNLQENARTFSFF